MEEAIRAATVVRGLAVALVLMLVSLPAAAGEDWPPITAQEKALKDDPLKPGAAAILLYRELYSDHSTTSETHFYRIKILTEEGKKHGDVEILHGRDWHELKDLKARVIQPDGRVVPFQGQVYEKTLAKRKGVKLYAKTFSLPDVQVGSIIEYSYRVTEYTAYEWVVQSDLTTLRGRFTLKLGLTPLLWAVLYDNPGLAWNVFRLPAGKRLEKEKGDKYRLELENIPAFEEEDYSPPERELKMRVVFYWYDFKEESPAEFWTRMSEKYGEWVEEDLKKDKTIEREVAALVSPGDSPETKLRKIYARVAGLRNLSFEQEKTGKVEKGQKVKERNKTKDVLKYGYGDAVEINRLFVAMARAAGFDAAVVKLVPRNRGFFYETVRNWWQLDEEISGVRVGDKVLYLEPSTPYTPFGLLPWHYTGVRAMWMGKKGGTFVQTPEPESQNAVEERHSDLRLSEEGSLEGTVRILFRGEEARWRRVAWRHSDEVERRKDLEDRVKSWFTAGTEVEIKSWGPWEASEEPLVAEVEVTSPGFAVWTGRRMLLPLGILQSKSKHPFEHARRVHPVYFDHPWQVVDEVRVELPEGWELEGKPAQSQVERPFGRFELTTVMEQNRLHIKRRMAMEGFYFRPEHYGYLREFYNLMRSGDEQQAVLRMQEVAKQD